jgi:alkylhydroperoxidase/carboxymuconolactone decarboxylase family protein YurZ
MSTPALRRAGATASTHRSIDMAGNPPQATDQQRDRLRDISDNDDAAIDNLIAIRVAEAIDASDLDAKTFALTNLAALIATGGDDSSYLLHVTAALDAGASVDEITGVLTAVGPNVGVFKMVAAADPLATALGISLAAAEEAAGGGDGGEGAGRGGGAGGGGEGARGGGEGAGGGGEAGRGGGGGRGGRSAA